MQTPRHIWITVAVATLALRLAPPVGAADPITDSPDRLPPPQWQQRLRAAAADLGLTEEQRDRVRELFAANRDRLRELWNDPNLTREQKQEKLQGLRAELEPELKKILTPEQWEKWNARQARGPRPTPESAPAWNLTDEQRAKLRELLQPHLETLRELRQNPDLTPQEKRERFTALRDELAPQLKAVLTPEQFERWQKARPELLRQLWERRQERRGQS